MKFLALKKPISFLFMLCVLQATATAQSSVKGLTAGKWMKKMGSDSNYLHSNAGTHTVLKQTVCSRRSPYSFSPCKWGGCNNWRWP